MDTLEPISFRQTFDGALAVFKHWGTFLRSSALGSVVGVMPGVGGVTATFVAYAMAPSRPSAIRRPSATAASRA